MLKELIKIANELDEKGLTEEADRLDEIIEDLKEDLEGVATATEVETVNKSVKAGDWIIRAMTEAGEEYSIREDKFPKLYNTEPIGEGPDGFMIYEVRPDDRTAIVVDKALAEELKNWNIPEGSTATQAEFHQWLLTDRTRLVTVRKQSRVYAKQADGNDEIVTRVQENNDETLLSFEAPWGGTMPVKLNDVLIVNEEEVYRIARAEFDQTYQPITAR